MASGWHLAETFPAPPPGPLRPHFVETTRLPVILSVVVALIAVVGAVAALLGPIRSPEFFITYALIQGAFFLGLIYLADIYDRQPITVVGLMVLWGGTIAC